MVERPGLYILAGDGEVEMKSRDTDLHRKGNLIQYKNKIMDKGR